MPIRTSATTLRNARHSAKKGKLGASADSKNREGANTNIAVIHNQVLMMLDSEIFDPELSRRVLRLGAVHRRKWWWGWGAVEEDSGIVRPGTSACLDFELQVLCPDPRWLELDFDFDSG
jgi:hypothetical protein